MPICGWRKRIVRPFPRLRISMFAPAIFSVTGPTAESMVSVHLDLRFADDPAPALVLGLEQIAKRRVGQRQGLGALLQQQLLAVGLIEYAVDLAVHLREHSARGRRGPEQPVPDYHAEIREEIGRAHV